MPNWLRWILVLPASLVAYIGIQLITGLSSEQLPLPDVAQDLYSQAINSILGPWAFVYAGARISPLGRRFFTSVALAILFGVFTGSVGVLAVISNVQSGQRWWLVASAVVGLVAAGVTCVQVQRSESEGVVTDSWVKASRRDAPSDVQRLSHHKSKVAPSRFEAALTRYKTAEATFEPLRAKLNPAEIKDLFDTILVCKLISDDEAFEADMALMGLLDGIIPSAEGVRILKTVFGVQIADAIGLKAEVLLGHKR